MNGHSDVSQTKQAVITVRCVVTYKKVPELPGIEMLNADLLMMIADLSISPAKIAGQPSEALIGLKNAVLHNSRLALDAYTARLNGGIPYCFIKLTIYTTISTNKPQTLIHTLTHAR